MEGRDEAWRRTVQFHGHECVGLALGFQVAEAALHSLGARRDVDEELVAIVENDSCAVDAIQVMTGCTLGKGNLIYKDYGKQGYTFVSRGQNKAVRITARRPDGADSQRLDVLRRRIASGEASEEEKLSLRNTMAELTARILSTPFAEICEIREVSVNVPERARLFPSITCTRCGEKVMEPRARIKDGQIVCIPCASSYTRGW
ncbi:MAG: FmdE family protein [Bacillota bacterium]